MRLVNNWYAENERIFRKPAIPGRQWNRIGYCRQLISNTIQPVNTGGINNAYIPIPLKAAMMAAPPLITCRTSVRQAMNLKRLFLSIRAPGTVFQVTNSKFTDRMPHIATKDSFP